MFYNTKKGGKMQELEKAGIHGSFKGDSKFFSKNVKVSMMFKSNEWRNFSGALVEFEASARSAWHTHPCGQHLIVVEGIGLTQEEGGEILEFHEGEALYCPKDKKHWHGASPDCRMKHIAITGDKDGNNVTWLEHVTDEEYNAYKKNKS